jgi:hypothetical protein
MKRYLIFIIILTLPLLSFGQINLKRLFNEYCDCYKKLNEYPENKTDKSLRNCLAEKNKLFTKVEFVRLFSTAQNQIEFFKEFVGTCEEFVEYSLKTSLKGENISDKEYTDNIYYILGYFSSESELGKLPKTVTIQPFEIGILYNIFLNKISTDTLYKYGTHIIAPHDSLIICNLKPQSEILSLSVPSKNSEEIKISIRYRYNVKPDSVIRIYKEIGNNYNEIIIIPYLESNVRSVLSNYSSKELYLIGKGNLSDIIESEITQTEGPLQLFDVAVTVNKVEFPHIISRAKAANLLESYELLNSEDSKDRLLALNQLFENLSETAYLIILDHWSTEREQENLDYILKRMTEKK